MTATAQPKIYERHFSRFIAALLSLFVLDATLFRTSLYKAAVKMQSSAGQYKFRRELGDAQIHSSKSIIAVVGDSRIAEGFSSRVFDNAARDSRLSAVNLGVCGSSLRVWYYLLKQVDPNHHAFRLVVIPMVSYRSQDEKNDPANRATDLQYLLPYVPPSDCVELASTYPDLPTKAEIALGTIFKGYALRYDVRDFVFNAHDRLVENRRQRRVAARADYKYKGHPGFLPRYEFSNRAWRNTEGPTDETFANVINERVFAPLPLQTGERQRFELFWLSKIADLYANSDTKLLIVKIPTDPFPRKIALPPESLAIQTIAKRPNVVIAPENLFDDLDDPHYFFDNMHLNNYGRAEFSRRLSSLILDTLNTRTIAGVQSRTTVSHF